MAYLDRDDIDDLWMGVCAACGEDVIVDAVLGQKLHRVGREIVCEACYTEFNEDAEAWDRQHDLRGYE